MELSKTAVASFLLLKGNLNQRHDHESPMSLEVMYCLINKTPYNVKPFWQGGLSIVTSENCRQPQLAGPCRPLRRCTRQVIGAATGFVAYNATGLDALQPGSPARMEQQWEGFHPNKETDLEHQGTSI